MNGGTYLGVGTGELTVSDDDGAEASKATAKTMCKDDEEGGT